MIFTKTFRTFLISLSVCLLAGCATTGRVQSRPQLSANSYLQMAANATGPTKQAYLLKATSRFIDEHQISRAQSVLTQTNSDLPPNLSINKQLVSAKLLIAYRQNNNALNILNSMDSDRSTWTTENKIEWHQLAAQANKNIGNIDASIQQRSDALPLLTASERKENTLAIWQSIENMSNGHIRDLLAQSKSPTVKGWLSLAILVEQDNVSPQVLVQQLRQWKSEYRNHPATALLPSSIRQISDTPGDHPKQIALLLPLTGRYAKPANAIKNGFLAAYYNAKKNNEQTPNLIIIDTAHKNIESAYQEAINKGANFVVGPLTKENITTLVKSTRLSVPTLALNSPTNLEGKSISNLYQFGLSPIDEARQAATKAWDTRRHSALIIYPKTDWGQSIVNAFDTTWQSLGGQIAGSLTYSNQQELSKEIKRLMRVDIASADEKTLKKTLGEHLRYIPRRRKDIDVIFMVASPYMARQIKPMLSYYYAGNIPVYTISNIYSGHPNGHRDHDLNGVHFPDMPWVLSARMKPNSLNEIREHVKQVWPQSFESQPKLYALGVDAYDIIPKLNKMAMLPDLGTPAATGTLYLNKNNHVYRQLKWSTIKNGTPHHIQ